MVTGRPPAVRRQDSGLVGKHDGLDAVAQIELLKDVGDVMARSRRAGDVR
jgi:hypothetical protein